MNSFKALRSSVIAAVTLAGASAAHAVVLFSNFGPGDIYRPNIGETLSFGGPLGGDAFEHAVPFTISGGDFTLDSAEVAVFHFWGPDLVFADIRTDADGVPGGVLETTAAHGVSTPGEIEPPMVLPFTGDLLLEDGQTYWLALRTDRTDAHLAWALNDIDDFGPRAWRVNEGTWNPAMGIPGTDSQRAVYRINATPIPAPGAVALLLIAGGACGRRRGLPPGSP